ncbi:TniB family NTP-binding protein [Burkholderia sp. RS01]|uniref:TniB family NTP-binding protein n=1 Tax=unclassified Burkholderia TaxID=2613784 RepID=UPI0032181390
MPHDPAAPSGVDAVTSNGLHRLSGPIEDDKSLMRWESLNNLLGPSRKEFQMIDRPSYDALESEDRMAFNRARIRYMAGGMIITTCTVLDLIRQFTKAHMMNDGSLIGRRGVMLSSPASTGKSTACLALIEYYLSRYEKDYPGAIAEGAVPAIYVSIPATRTVKGVLQRIARFLALPFKNSDTETDLAAMLQATLPAVSTKLIVLDEVQMLGNAASLSRPAVNNLKDLTNYFEGTIVYSGLELKDSELLQNDEGLQLKRRVFNVEVIDFTGKMTDKMTDEWAKIVAGFAEALPLYATTPELLSAEAGWLHWFTGGNIGTLKAVLLDAAASLILEDKPGQETITRGLLELSVRDYAAETGNTNTEPAAPLQGAGNRRRLGHAGN